jgi:hypothetical protein
MVAAQPTADLGKGNRPLLAAVEDPGDIVCLLQCTPPVAQEGAAGNHRRQVGFTHQPPAKSFAKNHDIRGATADPALGFGEGHRQPAELGELLPQRCVVAGLGAAEAQMVGYVTMIGNKPANAVLQQDLFFAKGKVHANPMM